MLTEKKIQTWEEKISLLCGILKEKYHTTETGKDQDKTRVVPGLGWWEKDGENEPV